LGNVFKVESGIGRLGKCGLKWKMELGDWENEKRKIKGQYELEKFQNFPIQNSKLLMSVV
jgi:hypothetical protein